MHWGLSQSVLGNPWKSYKLIIINLPVFRGTTDRGFEECDTTQVVLDLFLMPGHLGSRRFCGGESTNLPGVFLEAGRAEICCFHQKAAETLCSH